MPADLAKLRTKVRWLPIDCGDGDTFDVGYRPDRYSWNEALEWQKKLAISAPEGAGDAEKEAVEKQKVDLILEWAGPPDGLITGFRELTDNGEPVQATNEGMRNLPMGVLGLVFESVTEALAPGKKSGTV